MVVEARINHVRVVLRGEKATDICQVRDAGKFVVASPVATSIVCDLDKPVVSADIDQSVFLWRLRESDDVAIKRGRVIFGHRVWSPDSSHDGKLIAIELACKI